jgi:hypothetical protein
MRRTLASVLVGLVASGCVTTTRRVEVPISAASPCLHDCQTSYLDCMGGGDASAPPGSRLDYSAHSPEQINGCRQKVTTCVSHCDH